MTPQTCHFYEKLINQHPQLGSWKGLLAKPLGFLRHSSNWLGLASETPCCFFFGSTVLGNQKSCGETTSFPEQLKMTIQNITFHDGTVKVMIKYNISPLVGVQLSQLMQYLVDHQ